MTREAETAARRAPDGAAAWSRSSAVGRDEARLAHTRAWRLLTRRAAFARAFMAVGLRGDEARVTRGGRGTPAAPLPSPWKSRWGERLKRCGDERGKLGQRGGDARKGRVARRDATIVSAVLAAIISCQNSGAWGPADVSRGGAQGGRTPPALGGAGGSPPPVTGVRGARAPARYARTGRWVNGGES
jgi:hypothetical protein